MAKIAIPVYNKLLSNQFNACGHYDIFEISDKQIVSKTHERHCKKSIDELNTWVQTQGITDVIVHSIDRLSINYFSDTKINLFLGVKITSPEKLIDDYLKGTLQSNTKILQ